jgi:hypothetical protein
LTAWRSSTRAACARLPEIGILCHCQCRGCLVAQPWLPATAPLGVSRLKSSDHRGTFLLLLQVTANWQWRGLHFRFGNVVVIIITTFGGRGVVNVSFWFQHFARGVVNRADGHYSDTDERTRINSSVLHCFLF